MDTLKALDKVDFTKYALLPIINMYSGQKLAKVKNAENLSKIIFSFLKIFMHICNMSLTYLQRIKRIQWKL